MTRYCDSLSVVTTLCVLVLCGCAFDSEGLGPELRGMGGAVGASVIPATGGAPGALSHVRNTGLGGVDSESDGNGGSRDAGASVEKGGSGESAGATKVSSDFDAPAAAVGGAGQSPSGKGGTEVEEASPAVQAGGSPANGTRAPSSTAIGGRVDNGGAGGKGNPNTLAFGGRAPVVITTSKGGAYWSFPTTAASPWW